MANVLVLKPLPIQQADRLRWILASGPGAAPDRAGISLPDYAAFRARAEASWIPMRRAATVDPIQSLRQA